MPGTGSINIPFPLELFWLIGEAEFTRYTSLFYLPPNLDVTIRWSPKDEDKVFLVFAMTFGSLRDYNTGETVYTDEIGLWCRGPGIKFHWNPLLESVSDFIYPILTPTTRNNPLEIRFVNRSSITAYMDVSIWYFELTRYRFESMINFVKGFTNLFKYLGMARNIDEIRRLLGLR